MRLQSIIAAILMALVQQTGWAQNNTGLLGEWEETDYSDFEITHEFFTPNGTAASGSGGYDMTGYIPVKDGDIIVFSGERSPGIPFMMGYADNSGKHGSVLLGNFDAADYSNLSVREEEVIIPAGISYVRCSARNTSLPGWATRNMSVIKRTFIIKEPVVHILAIGNSFAIDAMESDLYDIAKASGIRLVLGNACQAGYSLQNHLDALTTNLADLEYRKCVDRHFTVTKGYTLRDILTDEPWDFITFQQTSFYAGLYDTYEPYLTNLINQVKGIATNPDAKYGFYMVWAYAQNSTHSMYGNYNHDQMTMFNGIVDASSKVMLTHPELDFLIPTGTAVQNMRTSFVGDNLTRDGAHLTEDIGRSLAAYSWFATLFGIEEMMQNTFVPYTLNEYTTMMAKNCVASAIEVPYAITPQTYSNYIGDNIIVPADILFNFSFEGTHTDGWNDVMLHHVLTAGYKDTNGKDCGIVMQCDKPFGSGNTAGHEKTSALFDMPSDVSKTALWGYTEGTFNNDPQTPTATLQFKHFNKALTYDFTFFSSRAYSTDNRETQFTLAGKDTLSALLDASDNKTNTVTISNMRPDEDGTITLTVTAGPNNNTPYHFYYLNAMRISVHSPDFALEGEMQPVVGDTLRVSANGDMFGYSFKWVRGNALGTFDNSILSSEKDYVITEGDYEHWLRVTVSDMAGNTVFSKDVWISKLPVIYIDTEDGTPITSRTDYVTANLRIQGNADFELQYMDKTEIRGRGSSSWKQYPQKPYKLKLGQKTKLFGFGKSKHWVLIPNFNDKSCLRNYIASELAKQLDVTGMDMTWVDVVLNGEAKGCYMLSQHVRVDKHSVDIFDWESEAEDVADALFDAIKEENALEDTDKKQLEDVMEQNLSWVTDGQVSFKDKTYNLSDYGLKKEYDITKGYLFEASDKTDGQTRFVTPNQVNIEVGAPEYLRTNSEMMNFVTTFWNDFEAEYCRVPTVEGKDFGKYADMKSMVGIWLVNEIMGQGDPVNSRFSFIANDGKLHFGPAWDFDHSSGSWSTVRDVNAFYTLIHKLEFTYYKKWFPDPFLCQMAYDVYWNVARPFIMDCVSEGGEIDTKYALFAEAAQTNDILWGDYPSMLRPSAKPRTSAEDVEIFRTFLRGHIDWLDEQFQSVRTLIEAMNKICIYPCDPNLIDGIQEVASDRTDGHVRKVIKNKYLYIIKDGIIYSIEGKKIK